jgi:hypothetical protein
MKKIRLIFVAMAISFTFSSYAQLRVAVLIVGDYNPTALEPQWNGGNLNGQDDWREFWNDSYLLRTKYWVTRNRKRIIMESLIFIPIHP